MLLNRGLETSNLSVSWGELGIPASTTVTVYDVIKNQAASSATGSFSAAVPSHDVAFVILAPKSGGSLH